MVSPPTVQLQTARRHGVPFPQDRDVEGNPNRSSRITFDTSVTMLIANRVEPGNDAVRETGKQYVFRKADFRS
jgi:hypothetical protein